jgi:folate-binding protein YgfZ
MSVRPSEFLPAAGLMRLSGRAQLRLTGRDRASFLHNFCTNDIKRLQPGQGCEAFLTNVKGRILGHIQVFAENDSLVVDSVAGSAEPIQTHLDRYIITEDVAIADETAATSVVYLFGQGAVELISRASFFDATALSPWGHVAVNIAEQPVAIRRVDFTAAPGFELCAAAENEEAVMSALLQAGAEPVSESDFNAYRIDAGSPEYGIDLTDAHLAQEASRTARAISFTKGCYLGQEPIARIDALGHVNRELRIVVFAAEAPVKIGDVLLDASSRVEAGLLTSLGQVNDSARVGLATLRTTVASGANVIASHAEDSPGVVVAIP